MIYTWDPPRFMVACAYFAFGARACFVFKTCIHTVCLGPALA